MEGGQTRSGIAEGGFVAAVGAGVGGVMRRLRLARGLTLEELAKRVGCVKGYLSAIERGKRPPPRAELAARLERELAAPADLFVRAAAWCRTPERIRAEIRGGQSGASGGNGEAAGEAVDATIGVGWLRGLPGFEEARCATVMIGEPGMARVERGDVAILGPPVHRESLRDGWLIAVEWPDGNADFVRWPGETDGAEPMAYRRVLGVCRAL